MAYEPDYYHILELPKTSSPKEVKRAFRVLAKKYHPDMNAGKEKWAAERFAEIKKAYDVLSDAGKKSDYDRRRSPSQTSYSSHSTTYSSKPTAPNSNYQSKADNYHEKMQEHYTKNIRKNFDISSELLTHAFFLLLIFFLPLILRLFFGEHHDAKYDNPWPILLGGAWVLLFNQEKKLWGIYAMVFAIGLSFWNYTCDADYYRLKTTECHSPEGHIIHIENH